MSMKNPLTLAGIKPATFRFVAQRLNHCATADVDTRAVPVDNVVCAVNAHCNARRVGEYSVVLENIFSP